MKTRGLFLALSLLGCTLLGFASTGLPSTPVRPVVNTYQGVQVTDPYRWLENASDPKVQAWTQAEDAYARAYLAALPQVAAIKARLQGWYSAESPSYQDVAWRPGHLFVLQTQPPKSQPLLAVMSSPDAVADARVLVDPNQIDAAGTTAIDFFVPSRDGSLVAVSMSKGGSEDGTLFIFDTATGKQLPDQIPHVQKPTAGGSVAWAADNSAVYYTRYPQAGERPAQDLDFYQQIYLHKLGTEQSQDTYCLGKDFPRIAEVALQSSHDGKYVLAEVANGDGGEYEYFVLGPDGNWTRLTSFSDRVIHAEFGLHDDLFLLSRQDAPRGRILHMSLDHPVLTDASVVVPESTAVINAFRPTQHELYVLDIVGGPSRLRRFDLAGTSQGDVKLPPVCAVQEELVRVGDDALLFQSQTYLSPPAWYQLDGEAARKTALAETSPVDFSDTEVVRDIAVSKDGTRVPLNILRRKGTRLNGHNPTLLYAYGGFGITQAPHFSPKVRLWLEHGGVYVVANIRGGGEFGEAWHMQGNLTHKQNDFDDFAAAARHLISAGYTHPSQLAIEGGSNGGLLMGAVLTQHPELYAAVISHVGIYDMLRVEGDPNGAFNTTEYGTVKDLAQFKALYGYSPFHHVQRGVRYPAVLLTTGVNDGRVSPYHSKKMAAILQASTASHKPVLLRVNYHAGHGVGTGLQDKIGEQADGYAFLFQALHMH